MWSDRRYEDRFTLSSSRAECEPRSRFLCIWCPQHASGGFPEKWASVYCEPSYWSRPVNVTLAAWASNNSVAVRHVEPLGDRIPFNSFNASVFEDLAATGFAPPSPIDQDSQGNTVGLGYLPPQYPDPEHRLAERFGNLQIDLLNRRSIGGLTLYDRQNDSLTRLMDPGELRNTYSKAYKLLFASAMPSELRLSTEFSRSPTSLSRTFEMRTLAVNVVWCRGLEDGLLVVIVFTIFPLLSTTGRRCNLDGEPNSLLESMLAIATNKTLLDSLQKSEYHPEEMHSALRCSSTRYRLRLVEGQGPAIEAIGSGHQSDDIRIAQSSDADSSTEAKRPQPAQHWVLRPSGKVLYLFYFGSLLLALAALRISEQRRDGELSNVKPNVMVCANTGPTPRTPDYCRRKSLLV